MYWFCLLYGIEYVYKGFNRRKKGEQIREIVFVLFVMRIGIKKGEQIREIVLVLFVLRYRIRLQGI